MKKISQTTLSLIVFVVCSATLSGQTYDNMQRNSNPQLSSDKMVGLEQPNINYGRINKDKANNADMMSQKLGSMNQLKDGYGKFYSTYFEGTNDRYKQLAKGQHPKTLIIGCCDSRVDPSVLTDTRPGSIFVVRNIANLVPHFESNLDCFDGVSAALEYAVKILNVENIIVLGHSQCGGIKALMDGVPEILGNKGFVASWIKIAEEARKRTNATNLEGAAKYEFCEKEAIKISLNNLLTFSWIQKKIKEGNLSIYGWYFSMDSGKLFQLKHDDTEFTEVPTVAKNTF